MKTRILLSIFWLIFTFRVTAQMRVHQINVGQGCATLVEFPCAAILIDTGSEKNPLFDGTEALKNYLENFFNSRPDLNHTLAGLYITHPHSDHTRGISFLLQPPYKIKNAVTNGLENGSGRYDQKKLHDAIATRALTTSTTDDIRFQKVMTTDIGPDGLTSAVIDPVNCIGTDPLIRILWGNVPAKPAHWSNGDFNEGNNHSLAIRIDYGEASLLITGDLELKPMQDMVDKYGSGTLLDADVYLVSHHGSLEGVTSAFLKKVTPDIALIGCGDPARETSMTAWAHGHPRKEILDTLQQEVSNTRPQTEVMAGMKGKQFETFTVTQAIYTTGWDGDILLEGTATGEWRNPGMAMPGLINLNTATQSELESLPGIGPAKARAIITYRTAHGNFTSVDQLINVPTIGPATLEMVRGWVEI